MTKATATLGKTLLSPGDLGYYSVHTTPTTLEQGEAEIQRIGSSLRASGRLRR